MLSLIAKLWFVVMATISMACAGSLFSLAAAVDMGEVAPIWLVYVTLLGAASGAAAWLSLHIYSNLEG